MSRPSAPTLSQWESELLAKMGGATNRYLRMLLYGDSGEGKTVLSMRLLLSILEGTGKKVLYLDSGTGFDSFENHPDIGPIGVKWDRIPVTKLIELEGIAKLVHSATGKFAEYGGIIVDEYSTMIESDLAHITEITAAASTKGKDPDVPLFEDFNASKARGVKYAQTLLRADKTHIILVSHQREDKMPGDAVKISPKFNPKMGSSIREKFSVVGYMTTDELRDANTGEPVFSRKIQVWPSKYVVAKTRIGGLKAIVKDYELGARIKEWIKGNLPEVESTPDAVIPEEYKPISSEDD